MTVNTTLPIHTCSDIYYEVFQKPLTCKTFNEVDNTQRGDTRCVLPVNKTIRGSNVYI